MACEIAFCHGAYIPTPDSLGESDQVMAFVEREVRLVASVHRRCAQARPLRILYGVNGELAGVEQAIIENQLWQVFVAYDNGLRVWVNLHPSETWPVTLPHKPSWACGSALIDGSRHDFVGAQAFSSYVLPPNGWLAAQWP
jgi:hypothetical protein